MENGIWLSARGRFHTMRTCAVCGLQEFAHVQKGDRVYWVCMECNNKKRRKRGDARHYHTPEMRAKISARMMGNKNLLGYKHRPESLAKMSASLKGVNRDKVGEKASQWKGGLSFEPYCPKFNPDLKRRIRAFFDHRCIVCGKTTEENGKRKQLMSCHHVEYNKQACCDGKPVHFATLCVSCHTKTGNNRDRWEATIHRIIDEIYAGKSYFTKEEWGNRID